MESLNWPINIGLKISKIHACQKIMLENALVGIRSNFAKDHACQEIPNIWETWC